MYFFEEDKQTCKKWYIFLGALKILWLQIWIRQSQPTEKNQSNWSNSVLQPKFWFQARNLISLVCHQFHPSFSWSTPSGGYHFHPKSSHFIGLGAFIVLVQLHSQDLEVVEVVVLPDPATIASAVVAHWIQYTHPAHQLHGILRPPPRHVLSSLSSKTSFSCFRLKTCKLEFDQRYKHYQWLSTVIYAENHQKTDWKLAQNDGQYKTTRIFLTCQLTLLERFSTIRR